MSEDQGSVFVWHRTLSEPFQISIYDIATAELIGRMRPNRGNTVQWTGSGHLMLTSGCGTNCGHINLYSRDLSQSSSINVYGEYVLGPQNLMLLLVSRLTTRAVVLNLASLSNHTIDALEIDLTFDETPQTQIAAELYIPEPAVWFGETVDVDWSGPMQLRIIKSGGELFDLSLENAEWGKVSLFR